jgi:hypothetical protein
MTDLRSLTNNRELITDDCELLSLLSDNVEHPNDCPCSTCVPLSPEALAALDEGIRSAQESPGVDLGSFAQYADDV